jgi:hypothetical protein
VFASEAEAMLMVLTAMATQPRSPSYSLTKTVVICTIIIRIKEQSTNTLWRLKGYNA